MSVLLWRSQPHQAGPKPDNPDQELAGCPLCHRSQIVAGSDCLLCAYEAQNASPEHQPTDRLVAGTIAFAFSFLAALLFSLLPGGADPLFQATAVLMAFAVAIGIAEAVLRGIQGRYFRSLAALVVGCFALAVLLVAPVSLLTQGLGGLIMPGCLLVIGAPTILAWLR